MIDLHCHSIFSDGDLTPNELLKKANELHLSYFSITDHNNCLAYENMDDSDFNGVLVPGVEIVTSFENHIIEILGYGIDTNKINDWYRKNIISKTDNIKYLCNDIIDVLKKNNIFYTPIENIEEKVEGKPKQYFYQDILKYEENKKKIDKDILESFSNFNKKGLNNPNSMLFINESKRFPSIEHVVELVHKSNGLCFLAHVYQYNVENHIQFIERIRKKVNLDGIEVFHSSFSKKQILEINEYADRNNLYKSGGSDYHGKLKPGVELGSNLQISDKLIDSWKNKIIKDDKEILY